VVSQCFCIDACSGLNGCFERRPFGRSAAAFAPPSWQGHVDWLRAWPRQDRADATGICGFDRRSGRSAADEVGAEKPRPRQLFIGTFRALLIIT